MGPRTPAGVRPAGEERGEVVAVPASRVPPAFIGSSAAVSWTVTGLPQRWKRRRRLPARNSILCGDCDARTIPYFSLQQSGTFLRGELVVAR
jgi:hypothetical protein